MSSTPSHKLVLSIGFITCLTLVTFDLCHSVSLDIQDRSADALTRDARSYLDAKILEFETTLQKTLGLHQRQKRYVNVPDIENKLTWQLEPLPVIEYNESTVIEHFYVDGDSYLIVGKSRGDDGISYEALAVIFKYDAGQQQFLDTGVSIPTSGLSDITSHLIANNIYIAIANQQFAFDVYNGISNIYRFDHVSSSIHLFMPLATKGVSDMEFFDYRGDVYLGVANMKTDLHAALRVNVEIYQFLYTGFDFITSTETYGARSIATFESDGVLYIAVAQYSDNDENYDIGTNVYSFDTGTPELKLVQPLLCTGAVHVESMLVFGQQYLAIANTVERDGSNAWESIIYWWEGNQFWEYQTLPTELPSHIEFIPVTDDIHLLAVVNQKDMNDGQNVDLYEYDSNTGDWTKTTQIPSDGIPGTVAMTTIIIGDEMFLGLANSYRKYSSNSEVVNNTNFYKIALVNETIELEDLARPSKICMNKIEARLQVAKEELVNLTAVVNQSMSLTQDQQITGPITIVGNVSVETVLTIQQNISIGNEFEYMVDQTLVGDIDAGYETTETLKEDIEDNAVTLDGEQVITGHQTFEEDVSVVGITEADLTSNDGSINSILHLGDFNDTILRTTGDQVIDGVATFEAVVKMEADVDVALLVNDINMWDDIMTLDDDQTSTGYLTFDTSVTFDSNVQVDGLINEVDFDDVISTVWNHSIAGNKFVNGSIDAVVGVEIDSDKTIDGIDISDLASQVIFLSTGGTITDEIAFNSSSVTFTNVTITNDLINEVDITKLIDDLFFVDTNQVIQGAKNFTQNINVDGNLTISGTINDIDVSESLITLATDQNITTDIKVQNSVTVNGDVSVTGEVNGVDLSAEAILDTGDQAISGPVNFTNDVNVQSNINMDASATLSDVDISELDATSMKLTGPQTINGVKTFEQSVEVEGSITLLGLVNAFNITQLDDNILSLSRPQTYDLPTSFKGNITLQGAVTLESNIDDYLLSNFTLLDSMDTLLGHKTFLEETTISSNLNLTDGNLVNGVSLPDLDQQVLRNVGDQTIQTPINFTSDLYVEGHVTVTELINELNMDEDLVTLNGSQNILGHKTFSNASVSGGISASKLNVTDAMINEVHVVDVVDAAVLSGQDGAMMGEKTFDNIDVIGDVIIAGEVNRVDLQDFDTSVFKLNETQTITGNITFSSNIHILGDMSIDGNLNGIDIGARSPLVVLKDENGTISGSKWLESDLTIQGNLTVAEFVNDIDIPHLHGVYLSKTEYQSISGRKNFTQDIHLENLTLCCGGKLDTANTTNLALIDADAVNIFHVAMEFDNDVMLTKDIKIMGLVDDVDIEELNNTGIKIDGPPQMVDGYKQFNSIEVDTNITMVDGALANGVDISELDNTSVKVNGSQTINVTTVFEEPVVIHGNLESYDLLGPLNLRDLLADIVFFNTNESISGHKIFTDPIEVTMFDIDANLDVNVNQGRNNLQYVMNNTLTKTRDQEIYANITFTDDVVLQANLDVNGLLNDIQFPENAVLVYSNQTITMEQTFDSGFEVRGDLYVEGLIDTVEVDVLANYTVTLSSEQVINGSWQFHENVNVTGNISVVGQVNDLVVRDNLVTINSSQTLNGTKTFLGNVTISSDMECTEMNDEDLVNFVSDMVLHEGTFEITAKKNFSSPLTISCNAVEGLVDGINVTEIPRNINDSNVYQDNWIEWLNQTAQDQCPILKSLQHQYTGQPLLFSHWKDWQYLDSSSGSFIDTVPYEGVTLLVMSETSDTPFHHCVQTKLYICPSESAPCWQTNTTLGSSASAKLNTFDDQTFIVLTGSKQSDACSSQVGYSTATRVIMVENEAFNVTVEAETAVDTMMFEFGGEIYLAIANYKHSLTESLIVNSTLHRYNSTTMTFDLFQEFVTYGAKGVAFLEHDGNAWLAWANSFGTVESVIAQWNETEQKFQTSTWIFTNFASDVISFVADDVAYIAIANEKSVSRFGVSDCNQPVEIYGYSDASSWVLAQSIDGNCIIDLDVFGIDDLVYLVLVSSLDYITIYQWSGVSQFTLHNTLPVEGAVRAHPFIHMGGLYMAVARPVMCPFDEESRKPVIMQGVVKGQKADTVFAFWE